MEKCFSPSAEHESNLCKRKRRRGQEKKVFCLFLFETHLLLPNKEANQKLWGPISCFSTHLTSTNSKTGTRQGDAIRCKKIFVLDFGTNLTSRIVTTTRLWIPRDLAKKLAYATSTAGIENFWIVVRSHFFLVVPT